MCGEATRGSVGPMNRLLSFALLAVAVAAAGPVNGHLLNMTEATASVAADGELQLTLRLDLLRALGSEDAYFAFSRAPFPLEDYQPLWQRLADTVRVETLEGERIPVRVQQVEPPAALAKAAFESDVRWPMTRLLLTGRVSAATPLRITFGTAFPVEEPIALTMHSALTQQTRTRWLVVKQPGPWLHPTTAQAAIAGESLVTVFLRYLKLGVEHIIPRGIDHLLFVLGLFLCARSTRGLLYSISLFTLAHSVTLIAASYRLVELPVTLVEVLVAVSVLWVGASNLGPLMGGAFSTGADGAGAGETPRPWILVFGLLHGFGFANALAQLDSSADGVLVPLIAFNAGVELGQVLFVGALLALLWRYRQAAWYRLRVVLPASGLIVAVASVWIVQRVAGS